MEAFLDLHMQYIIESPDVPDLLILSEDSVIQINLQTLITKGLLHQLRFPVSSLFFIIKEAVKGKQRAFVASKSFI